MAQERAAAKRACAAKSAHHTESEDDRERCCLLRETVVHCARRQNETSSSDRRVRALVADRAFSRFHGVTWEAVAKSKQIDSLEDPVRLSDALCSVQACSRQQARSYHVRPVAAGVVICRQMAHHLHVPRQPLWPTTSTCRASL